MSTSDNVVHGYGLPQPGDTTKAWDIMPQHLAPDSYQQMVNRIGRPNYGADRLEEHGPELYAQMLPPAYTRNVAAPAAASTLPAKVAEPEIAPATQYEVWHYSQLPREAWGLETIEGTPWSAADFEDGDTISLDRPDYKLAVPAVVTAAWLWLVHLASRLFAAAGRLPHIMQRGVHYTARSGAHERRLLPAQRQAALLSLAAVLVIASLLLLPGSQSPAQKPGQPRGIMPGISRQQSGTTTANTTRTTSGSKPGPGSQKPTSSSATTSTVANQLPAGTAAGTGAGVAPATTGTTGSSPAPIVVGGYGGGPSDPTATGSSTGATVPTVTAPTAPGTSWPPTATVPGENLSTGDKQLLNTTPETVTLN